VRLTVNGRSQTQPIAIGMDPRARITQEVQQIFTLTTQMEARARAAASAYKEARALVDKLKAGRQSAANDALILQVDAMAPAAVPGAVRTAAAEPPDPPNLANIGERMVAAVMPMQSSEMPPTAAQLLACGQQEAAYTALMANWTALKAKVSGPAAPGVARQ